MNIHRVLTSFKNGADRSANTILSKWRWGAVYLVIVAGGYAFNENIFGYSWGIGESMSPTIPDHQHMLWINRRYKNGKGIQVGDCVQIKNPIFPHAQAGKRVIGLPGDYVLRGKAMGPTPGGAPVPGITDWKRRVHAERVALNQDMTDIEVGERQQVVEEEEEEEWEEPEMIQVPEGHVWLEGDNLGHSRDSRFFGAVPMALIKGRSSFYLPSPFSFQSLHPGKGLRKVQEWEMDAVLGEDENETKPK